MELRWYQREAVQAAWQWLCQREGNPVIVLPTGAGKSLCIADLAKTAVSEYQGRVLILAHRKELLQQNAAKLQAVSDLPIGINSAGLGKRETESPVIFAGIQSVYRDALSFGSRHLVIIDEVHLVPQHENGMYRKFLGDLRLANPRLKMVGLTATPFRTDSGKLCRADALFQGICYEAEVQRLIQGGFLSPVTNQLSETEYDTSRLKIIGGEFSSGDLANLFGEKAKIKRAVQEIVEKTRSRKSVLLFCSGVDHAILVAEELEKITQERVGLVTGETLPILREQYLADFRARRLRFLVNVDVLTTGFDAPCIDAIAILRATMSPGLFAQICGRGFRLYPGKENCLILDFGENIKRHGPVDAIDFGKVKSVGSGGEGPTKECPNCQEAIPAGKRQCFCGWLFPPREIARHEEESDGTSTVLAAPQKWQVVATDARKHIKRNKPGPATFRMDYVVVEPGAEGNLAEKTISEWVCFDHEGFARKNAVSWWRKRSKAPPPDSVDDALELWACGALASARSITTKQDGKFQRVIDYELDEVPEEWLDEPELDPFEDEEVPF